MKRDIHWKQPVLRTLYDPDDYFDSATEVAGECQIGMMRLAERSKEYIGATVERFALFSLEVAG